jgi:hydroxypyruvate isomerase
MNRRRFVSKSATAGAFAMTATGTLFAKSSVLENGRKVEKTPVEKFKLKYAPHFGTFRENAGKDPADQLKFMSDQGFRAVFDNGLMKKPPEMQERIARTLDDLNMDLGPFVMYADFKVESLVLNTQDVRDMLKKIIHAGIETAKRTNAKWALLVPGRYNQRMEWDNQTANVIDNLRFCAEIMAPAGLTMVLEPLNKHDHPGLFLTKIPQAYSICRAVNSPVVKIVDDLYHQQITEGNLMNNLDHAWDEIAAFHLGDNPGRKEPTTGEINFKNIFKHLYEKGYEGVLCMEHGNSRKGKEGELALIEAYREVDSFKV